METLFDSACRYMSDSELIYEITNNKKIVTETEQQSGEYDLNGLFSSLTPGRKKVALNNASRVIKKVRVSVGGITQTAADVRLIMRILVEVSATQFVVVHNHPSGNKQPSRDDKNITERLKKAGEVFDIRLIDHVIIAGDTYYSFSDEGIL